MRQLFWSHQGKCRQTQSETAVLVTSRQMQTDTESETAVLVTSRQKESVRVTETETQ